MAPRETCDQWAMWGWILQIWTTDDAVVYEECKMQQQCHMSISINNWRYWWMQFIYHGHNHNNVKNCPVVLSWSCFLWHVGEIMFSLLYQCGVCIIEYDYDNLIKYLKYLTNIKQWSIYNIWTTMTQKYLQYLHLMYYVHKGCTPHAFKGWSTPHCAGITPTP